MSEYEKRYWDSFERMYLYMYRDEVDDKIKKKILKMSDIYFNKIKNPKELRKQIIKVSDWVKKECYKKDVEELLKKPLSEECFIYKNGRGFEMRFHYKQRYLEPFEKFFVLDHLIPFTSFNNFLSDHAFFSVLYNFDKWEIRESEKYNWKRKRVLFVGSNVLSGEMSKSWVAKKKRIKKVRGGKEIFRDKKHFEKFNNVCFNCGSGEELVLDHHLPCKLGGSNNEENIVVLCRVCNSKKAARHPKEFYTFEKLEELGKKYGIR